MSPVHTKTKKPASFQIPQSGLKGVFEKLCFRDELEWTLGFKVVIMLRFKLFVVVPTLPHMRFMGVKQIKVVVTVCCRRYELCMGRSL